MFQLKAEDRLKVWRDFRSSIGLIPLGSALGQIAEFWSRAPFTPYHLDSDDTTGWPDPWTLIYENVYCDVAKCLGIVYTILLSDHGNAVNIEFRIYEDVKTGYEYNLAWIDQGKYILNMVDGEVLNNKKFDKSLKLKQQFTEEDLKLENYI